MTNTNFSLLLSYKDNYLENYSVSITKRTVKTSKKLGRLSWDLRTWGKTTQWVSWVFFLSPIYTELGARKTNNPETTAMEGKEGRKEENYYHCTSMQANLPLVAARTPQVVPGPSFPTTTTHWWETWSIIPRSNSKAQGQFNFCSTTRTPTDDRIYLQQWIHIYNI